MARDPEPPLPPDYSLNIQQGCYYCLHCVQFRRTLKEVIEHSTMHLSEGYRPEIGVDYTTGAQIILMRIRHEEWCRREIARYEMLLNACVGADDILLEIENG
jgi:hypothetical protein